MSSLQDQLLKAGLVDEKKLARANQEKNRQAKQKRQQRSKKGRPLEAGGERPQNRKAERDRELNRERQQQARRKELAAQATRLIVDNRLDRSRGEQPYGFVYKRKVKKIYVTDEQKAGLAEGRLAIATYIATDGRKFELLPKAIADRIVERDESFVVSVDAPADSSPDENDPYSGYQVPDDLTW